MEDKQFKESLDRYLTQSDEQIITHQGVDISECEHQDKACALIDFLVKENRLDCDALTLEETDYGNFVVNFRRVKEGTSPAQINQRIQALESLLTKKQIDSIKAFISDKNKTEVLRDKLYCKLKKHIEKKKDTEAYKFLKKECLYAENLIYHLLSDGEQQHEKQYHRALFKFKLADLRKFVERNDGEYSVMTDDEADEVARTQLEEGDYWEMAVESGNTEEGKSDWIDYVLDVDGRGSILSSYDGQEYYQEIYIDGVIEPMEFFIYRVD